MFILIYEVFTFLIKIILFSLLKILWLLIFVLIIKMHNQPIFKKGSIIHLAVVVPFPQNLPSLAESHTEDQSQSPS